jgi:hypothetical protein
MNVAPSATFEASIDWGATGATIGMRIVDNAGATTVARVTGFTEYPAGSGIYYKDGRTAPATAGQYSLVFDDDGGTAAVGHVAMEELLVTGDTAAVGGTSNLYVSETEVKSAADLLGETFADSEIDIVIPAVCRAIDLYKKTRYYPFTATRYYTAPYGAVELPIYDLNTLTELAVDDDGDYTYGTVWTVDTDFFLDPPNAAADGYPYRGIALVQRSSRFPSHLRAIKVTGSFGWAETPAVVKLAATKLAVRELAALKTAPMGLVIATETAARIGSMYRDIADLLDNLPPRPKSRSLQLG